LHPEADNDDMTMDLCAQYVFYIINLLVFTHHHDSLQLFLFAKKVFSLIYKPIDIEFFTMLFKRQLLTA